MYRYVSGENDAHGGLGATGIKILTAAANEDGEVSLGVGGCVSDLKHQKEISGDTAKHPRADAADAKADSKADAKAKTAARALAKHLLK